MEARVYKIVSLLVIPIRFSGCRCGSSKFIDISCDSCSGKLFILTTLILVYAPISATTTSFSNYTNMHVLTTTTTMMANDSAVPCLAGFSIFLEGNCVSCVRPLLLADFNDDLQSKQVKFPPKGALRPASNNLSINVITTQVFMCSIVSRGALELTKINEGIHFLNGRILQVVTIHRPPFVIMDSGKFRGVVFELLYTLQEKYNFTSKKFLPYDGQWGSVANRTWNGMVGQVLRKEADMGAAGFSVTLERAKVIDFSMSFHQEPTGILIPAPEAGTKLTILVRPLSSEVWLAIFSTVCVLVPSLFVMHIISLRIQRMREDNNTTTTTHKPVNVTRLIVDLIQFIIGSLVQEGMVSPVNKTTRFLVVIWWFLTLVLANIYVGYMVSFLSAPKLYDLVDNLEGLVHQHVLRWTFRKNTALEDLFQSNASGVYKTIGMGAQETDLAVTDVAGVEKVLSGHFAFLKEKSFLDVAIGNDFDNTQQCRMTIARETFFTVGFALIVQKGCAFLELLDKEILLFVATGLMEKWKRIHWPRHLWCVNAAQYIVSTQPKARKLNLDDCQGAQFLLMCGLGLACLAFAMEIMLKRCGCQFFKTCCFDTDDVTNNDDENDNVELKGYKIIVIPVKEDIYHKLNLFKATRKDVIDNNFIR